MASIENIRDLELFQLVAELGSFTDAAAAAGVSQPTVSLAVKRLESRLGATLLQRQRFGAGGGLSLTAEGLIVVRHTAAILGELDALADDLDAAHTPDVYTVGLPPIISAYLLGDASITMLADRLHGRISVQSVGSTRLMEQIERHDVDFGAVATIDDRPDDIGGIQSFKIASFPFELVHSAGNPPEALKGRHDFDFADETLFHDLRFVTLGGDFVHSKAVAEFLRSRIDVTQIIEVADVNTMKAIIASGLAVGLMASVAVRNDDRLAALPVAGVDLPTFDVYVFNDETRDPAGQAGGRAGGAQAFLDVIGRNLANGADD
ncbi:LysR family transcriptional regulator [Bifidobacterium sp. 82T24]|uniref:LysR family transcriptional regulator n=1 Tax=Bifidobacterium pluvialisilvae TaxID=2834436 RepID=UPI001C56C7D6|nr:LysR family transcriptional regulator [Bifidobacterium pluvialisilvae]MBW3087329.1 LysR family transcriptional regulator [Bifidobacterium pluvialisilvae]